MSGHGAIQGHVTRSRNEKNHKFEASSREHVPTDDFETSPISSLGTTNLQSRNFHIVGLRWRQLQVTRYKSMGKIHNHRDHSFENSSVGTCSLGTASNWWFWVLRSGHKTLNSYMTWHDQASTIVLHRSRIRIPRKPELGKRNNSWEAKTIFCVSAGLPCLSLTQPMLKRRCYFDIGWFFVFV